MNLKDINWFENVGVLNRTDFKIESNLVDKKKCISSINSLKWENFVLYAINRLSWYIQSSHKEESNNWNNIVRGFKAEFDNDKAYILEKASVKDVPEEIMVDTKGVVTMFLVENYFKEMFGNAVPIQFDYLMDVYVKGHIPCGWDGPMPENKGADAIDFSNGKILVW
ncbi:hypothetical protein [Chitinophaga sp. HK235]|uniref:hypothetical protein n=1 Tax=Chitinophaga sp. HK235 TaxID=2952571 RepID=UPI001BA7A1E9|nr:hypothetical protein [Chitinophaga sp. HK235]